MPRNFYSGTEAALASGADNLIAIVTPVPATYGLTAGEVTSYTALAADYSAKLVTANTPSTRTPVSIESKNIAKKLLKAACVNVARTIIAVPTVSNAELISLGLNERLTPTPRPVPSDAPVLEIVSVIGRMVKVRIHSGSSESRAKPFGAIGANIYSYVGVTAPTDPAEYHYEGMATRSTNDLSFPNSVPSGATVWLSASWISARGQTSVGSVPMSFTMQGGAIPAAA